MSTLDQDYRTLFATLGRLAEGNPEQVPQLLALILSGGAFRPALEKPEVLHKIVAMAKGFVRQKQEEAAARPAPMAKTPSGAKAPARTVSAQSLARSSGFTRA